MATELSKIHTKRDAELLVHVLSKTISLKYGGEVELIGSLSKDKETSNHDIDIYLSCKNTKRLENDLKILLCPTKVEQTDWGGIYFHSTPFGDIDFFFSKKYFDR